MDKILAVAGNQETANGLKNRRSNLLLGSTFSTLPNIQTPFPSANSLFEHVVPDIHNSDTGRLDAKNIAAFLGIPLAILARAIGREPASVHKTPDARSLQPVLMIFERLASALLYLAGSHQGAKIWLNAPNPDLDDQTPLALLEMGQVEVITELLEDALVGQPG